VTEKRAIEINGPIVLDVQLSIGTEAQVINVEDEANRVSTDAASNGSALILRERELATLSDDPDELAAQLQAMAGPGAGPNGGQIYIDGFTGGMLPSKLSIREVRINANPFAPEYERPGFGRIEILTRPGMDKLHGMVFAQYSKEALNARSPLLTSAQRPPYKLYFEAGSISGPIKKQKASFGFDFHERKTTEDAFILATTLDDNLRPLAVNQAILTPQHLTQLSPRLDVAINANNNLTIRNQYNRIANENQGVGSFNLASRAYNARSLENALQITETSVMSPRLLNEARFQFMRASSHTAGDNTAPSLTVQGAFSGGSAEVGNSGTTANRWEFSNTTSFTRNTHGFKWGGRVRQVGLDSTSVSNFGGSFTFLGGSGPELDAANRPIPGTSIQLTALERYRRTLLFQRAGMTGEQIRILGGGASQFSLSAGIPSTSVSQFDAGLFVNDDWRARPNLTLSSGVRYEVQTNISDHAAFAPRIGIAWGVDGKPNRPARTILRAGAGLFFDRISENVTLAALRFNGVTQQSYFLIDPEFFPAIPPVDVLAASGQPQTLQLVDSAIRAPRLWQASIGVERQVTKSFRLSANYVEGRGVHLQRSRDINAPIDGQFPFGDAQLRNLTETTGFSRTHMLQVTPSLTYKKLMAFGFYALSYGMTDAEGQAADPYHLRSEWGPSSFSDVQHRLVMGGSLPLPRQFSVSPFVIVASGTPYNITTGRDSNGDSIAAERPALIAGVGQAQCSGPDFRYAAGFGCFNLNPAPGTVIGRNSARGPGSINLNVRLARTWTLKGKRESGPNAALSGAAAAIHGPGGGGPPPGAMMAPPPAVMGAMMHGPSTGARNYSLTLTVSANNLLNHSNYAAPSGDLSSPYFGVSRSLAGGFTTMGGASPAFNRKLDAQLRLTF